MNKKRKAEESASDIAKVEQAFCYLLWYNLGYYKAKDSDGNIHELRGVFLHKEDANEQCEAIVRPKMGQELDSDDDSYYGEDLRRREDGLAYYSRTSKYKELQIYVQKVPLIGGAVQKKEETPVESKPVVKDTPADSDKDNKPRDNINETAVDQQLASALPIQQTT